MTVCKTLNLYEISLKNLNSPIVIKFT